MEKWWLISEEDVQALREIMVGDGQSRAALYILETSLHETDAVPADWVTDEDDWEDDDPDEIKEQFDHHQSDDEPDEESEDE